MAQNDLSTIETYKEACANLRHYSQAALHIRISAIAQCVVLVTAIGYLLKENSVIFASYASAFGLVFTFTLMKLHDSYQKKVTIFTKASSAIEKQFELSVFPVSDLLKEHESHVHSITGELLVTKGLFILMLFAFSFLLIQAFL